MNILAILLALTIPYRVITWEDFKGVPNPQDVKNGITGQLMDRWTLTDSTDDGKVYFTLNWEIVQERSWVTNDDPRLLAHEQCHADISMLWYRKFEKVLCQYQGCPERQKKKVIALFNYYWKESRGLQVLFDRDSRHGANAVVEKIYEHKIARDL